MRKAKMRAEEDIESDAAQVQYLHWGFIVISVMDQHKSTLPCVPFTRCVLVQ